MIVGFCFVMIGVAGLKRYLESRPHGRAAAAPLLKIYSAPLRRIRYARARMSSRDDKAASPPALIPPGEPEPVQELVRRELAQALALQAKEFEYKERARRYQDLLRIRRRLRASIKSREETLRSDKTELAEIERELSEIRLPPGMTEKR